MDRLWLVRAAPSALCLDDSKENKALWAWFGIKKWVKTTDRKDIDDPAP
jgi:hypothetical protein